MSERVTPHVESHATLPCHIPDTILLEEMRGGSRGAFDALFDRYFARVFRFVGRRVGETERRHAIVEAVLRSWLEAWFTGSTPAADDPARLALALARREVGARDAVGEAVGEAES